MGEVKFPGTYSIKRGETLKSVVPRAGGLTDLAFDPARCLRARTCGSASRSNSMRSPCACRAISRSWRCRAHNSNQASEATAALAAGQTLLDS